MAFSRSGKIVLVPKSRQMFRISQGSKVCHDSGIRAGKKACVLKRRDDCREGLQNSCARVGSPGVMRTWGKFALQLTRLLRKKICIMLAEKGR